jgi:CheY-like chemotaxis protein
MYSEQQKGRNMSTSAPPTTMVEPTSPELTRLLIIEDDDVHRMIIKRFSLNLGFTVAEADTYERAKAQLDADQIDCITLDLSIRAHSGVDVLCHLRKIGRRIPVLIISGSDEGKRSETAQFAESMNFKVLHVMKKPLDLQALQNALATLKTFVYVNSEVPPSH